LFAGDDRRFICRRCEKWDYASRHEMTDPARVASKLRERIGASRSLLDPLPPRPTDQQAARKYDAIVAEIAAYERLAVRHLRALNEGLERYAAKRSNA
jgi:hypothetical protein